METYMSRCLYLFPMLFLCLFSFCLLCLILVIYFVFYYYLYACFFFHESMEIRKEGDVGQLTGVGERKTIFRILSEKNILIIE